jgi:hypothetical protein
MAGRQNDEPVHYKSDEVGQFFNVKLSNGESRLISDVDLETAKKQAEQKWKKLVVSVRPRS